MAKNTERLDHIFEYIRMEVLTDSETSFVESIHEQYLDKGWLSPAQIEVLEKIFRESNAR